MLARLNGVHAAWLLLLARRHLSPPRDWRRKHWKGTTWAHHSSIHATRARRDTTHVLVLVSARADATCIHEARPARLLPSNSSSQRALLYEHSEIAAQKRTEFRRCGLWLDRNKVVWSNTCSRVLLVCLLAASVFGGQWRSSAERAPSLALFTGQGPEHWSTSLRGGRERDQRGEVASVNLRLSVSGCQRLFWRVEPLATV